MSTFRMMIFVALFAALALWTMSSQALRIESDIHTKAAAIAAMVHTMDVVVDGRNVRLQARIHTAHPVRLRSDVDELVKTMQQLTGVRQMHAQIQLVGPEQHGAGSQILMPISGQLQLVVGES